MESVGHVSVAMRTGGKKMRKRRELDALVSHSFVKRAASSKRPGSSGGVTSHDQLLSQSTDDMEDYSWSKPRVSSRCRSSKSYSCVRTCIPLLINILIFLTLGFLLWLYFDLRQQINEYRFKTEQVSAASQYIPDTLQKIHETNKYLEQNQTVIFERLSGLNDKLQMLEKEINTLKELVQKTDETNKNGNFDNLERNIAQFGAQLLDMDSRLNNLNSNYKELKTNDSTFQADFTNFRSSVNDWINKTTPSNGILSNDIIPKTLDALKQNLTVDIKNVSDRLTLVNETLSQLTKISSDEITAEKKNYGNLFDDFKNISSRVFTMEDEWNKYKTNALDTKARIENLQQNINSLSDTTNILKSELKDVLERRQQSLTSTESSTLNSLVNQNDSGVKMKQ